MASQYSKWCITASLCLASINVSIAATVGLAEFQASTLTGPIEKARRWIVEVCHSWFNRFRKLLVRYEKLERSFLALNHLAAGIIAFRKVHLKINIISLPRHRS